MRLIDGVRAQALLKWEEERRCVELGEVERCVWLADAAPVTAVDAPGRRAAALLEDMLARDPEDLEAGWLLYVAHMLLGTYPEGVPEAWRIDPARFADDARLARFHDAAGALGVDDVGHAGGALLATNWGRNVRPRPEAGRPLHLFFGDFDRSGSLDVIRAQRDTALDGLVPLEPNDRLVAAIPALARRLPDAGTYAGSTLDDALGALLQGAGQYVARRTTTWCF